MALDKNSHNKVEAADWVNRWQASMRYLEPAESHEFLKRLGQMAEQDQFSVPVKKFLEESVDADWQKAKVQLQNICGDNTYLNGMSSRTSFIFGANYYAVLENQVLAQPKKSSVGSTAAKSGIDKVLSHRPHFVLGLDDARNMSAYLVRMDYSKSMYDRVAKQSTVINAMADVAQYHKGIYAGNWTHSSDEDKSEYLTMVSKASNYMLMHVREDKQSDDQHIFTAFHRPHGKRIIVAQNVDGDKYLSGKYNEKEDRIIVNGRLDYTGAMKTLQHEKSHQLSAIENRRIEADPKSVSLDDRCVYVLQPYVRQLFHDNASKDTAFVVYYNTPEERLARSAETFVSPHHVAPETREIYAQKISEIFAQAPEAFDDVKFALDKMLSDIENKKMKRASGGGITP